VPKPKNHKSTKQTELGKRKLILEAQAVCVSAASQLDQPNEQKLAAAELLTKFHEWLDVQKLKADRLVFDNQPVGILKSFPKADATGITEARLVNKLWWWRTADEDKADAIFHNPKFPGWTDILLGLYQDYFELSAYYYELRARFDGRYAWGFGHPWVYCSREQRRMLGCLWPSSYPVQNWTPAEADKPEWRGLAGLNFNLKLNNSVLIEQFASELERLRTQVGIEAPATGQGIRRKPISWLPIELMDIRHYQIRTLNDSERSQVSKASRAYERACRGLITP
jgi:hypothetical protein